MHLSASAQVFTGGSSQTFTVCQNSTNNDFSSLLVVLDTSTIYPSDNFNVTNTPMGTVSGFPIGPLATGGVVTPAGALYTPPTSFTGNDIIVVSVDNGSGPVYTTINVVVNPLPSLTLTNSSATICQGTPSATFSFTGLTGAGPVTTVFSAVGNTQWTVPDGVNSLTFDVQGAAGSGDNYSGAPNPGFGGRVQGFFVVTPGQILDINVGGQGGIATNLGAAGGWNGGGNAYYYPLLGASGGTGGAGGGASDIRTMGTTLANRVIVAGGGGGNGWDSPYGSYYGGAGGGIAGSGGNSQPNVGGSSAGGGTQTTGGAAATRTGWISGTPGSWGQGGDGSSLGGIAGGGGGGYYGGGGGVWNGGGGGSDYTDPSSTSLVTHTPGYNSGGGLVGISYNVPATYTISNWSSSVFSTTTAPLPSTPITVNVPALAPAGTYTATVTINNGMCTSVSYPISITINPTPDITSILALASQTVCNGGVTTDAVFTGSVAGTVFNWTSSGTSIGLPSAGVDSIPSTMVTNGTPSQEVATILVTPTAAGCVGDVRTFNITANPTPMLSSSTTDAVCSGAGYTYTATSATIGVSYVWSRAAVPGITPGTDGGTSAIISDPFLANSTNSPIDVVYAVTLTANGCSNVGNLVVRVKPVPTLSGPTTVSVPTGVCGTVPVIYAATSGVSGTSFMWNRNVVTGIINPAETGTGDLNDTLTNNFPNPVTVTYNYTLMAAGCVNLENVTAIINPTPRLTSSFTNTPICSGSNFVYPPTGTPSGATFSWMRNEIPGISNGANSGSFAVNEALYDTTGSGIMETYYYTVMANGCSSAPTPVTVWVNPKPMLSSSLTPAGVCDNVNFVYNPTSNTAGTAFYWHRPTVAGISNAPTLNVNGVNEMLTNTTTHPVAVTYVYTLLANGCLDTQSVVVNINPTPRFTGTLTPPSICDSVIFRDTPTSNVNGASFNWTRNYIAGIYAPSRSGIGDVGEQLINTTNVNVNATYEYTATANGCTSNPVNVVVIVHPTAKLSSTTKGTVCSDVEFDYTPSSFTPTTTFKWNRDVAAGITPATGYGAGKIAETVTNSTTQPIVVQYLYQMTAYGCTNITPAHVYVTVNPGPAGARILGNYNVSPCSGTDNQTYGAVTAPANGVKYTWQATNASIWSTTANEQYILVNFPNAGTATLTLTAAAIGTQCTSSESITINVGSGASDHPDVIYYQGMFVCLNNQEDSYQWGYDNALTFASASIPGAGNQSYIDPSADFANYNYWVITTSNGCTQKTYYNPPKVATSHRSSENTLSVYPNPVTSSINLQFSNSGSDDMQYEVFNTLGQKLLTGTAPQASAVIDATNLPAGCYLIACYHDGAKIATTRFTKN